ncbi:MAG: MFS transporter [Clostridiaceae bacterium]|jgi:MFS family permease|nr:MFS transporter [Clostridiaceae bacterium]
MKKFLRKHQLLRTLVELRGNPRACVYTEPMWGLSMNLCLPYATVYMLTFGLSDVQVGIVTSIYMFSQMIFAFLSGAIIDKMGRRKSTAIFDFLAWSLPCLIWAFSQGFWFFVVAALFNGMMKITAVSWDCLLVEDAPKDKITHIYSWVIISGNLSALFAPISSILVAKLTLAPAIRILYINAFIIMTAKLLILYKFSTETAVGKIRREATRNMSWVEMLSGYKNALRKIQNSRGMVFAIIISILVEIAAMIGMTFWQIIASRRIGIPDTLLPIFPMARSILSIFLFFTVISRIRQSKLKWPLYGGFLSSIIGCILLISITNAGVWGYVILSISLIFEALGMAVLNTLRESLVAIHADRTERSVIMALLQTTVMLVSVPFGYIGGLLSDISRVLPFVLSIALLMAGMLATAVFYRKSQVNRESEGDVLLDL